MTVLFLKTRVEGYSLRVSRMMRTDETFQLLSNKPIINRKKFVLLVFCVLCTSSNGDNHRHATLHLQGAATLILILIAAITVAVVLTRKKEPSNSDGMGCCVECYIVLGLFSFM